jgi:hypothetical protein
VLRLKSLTLRLQKSPIERSSINVRERGQHNQ